MNVSADHIDAISFNTGIAKTAAGGTGIGSGVAIIGGVLLAPFTAGWSLGFTIAGAVGGVAAGATTITSDIIKN